MFDEAKHLIAGAAKYANAKLLMSHTDMSKQRVAVCNACELLSKTRACTVCMCFVDQKAKYDSEHCPIAQVKAVVGQYGLESETLILLDKWGQTVQVVTPADFAAIGDIVALPRDNRIVNLRTEQEAAVSIEPKIMR